MTKISRFPVDFKPSERIYYYLTGDEYLKFKRLGIIAKKFHAFHFTLNYREIQVECPVIIRDKRPVAVIFPAFKIPYRPYPVFVYLFAVALCLTGISMRKAAIATGKRFGILKFSHSTISRVFSLMAANYTTFEELFNAYALNTSSDASLPGRPKCIISNRYSDNKKKVAPFLFNMLSPILNIEFKDNLLVYEHFIKFCCLLL